jgi:transposase
MGNPAGVKRNFEALEKRRRQAIQLMTVDNLNQSETARRLKVARQTVSRWMREYRAHGEAALKRAGRAGRKPLLSPAQRERIVERLQQGPQQLGYETPLWTCPRVAHLIEEECGIRYHPGHVWKLLDSLGWSCQRPTGRALQRNEEQIREWKSKTWPAIKKKRAGKAG